MGWFPKRGPTCSAELIGRPGDEFPSPDRSIWHVCAPRSNAIVFTIDGPVARADLLELCDRLRGLLERSDADVVLCDVGAVVPADAVTIDALARLQLTALRVGRRIVLRHASTELHELLAFMGLVIVLRVEPGGEAEEREQRLRVQEEGELDDPSG
jgi:hypothetical protein